MAISSTSFKKGHKCIGGFRKGHPNYFFKHTLEEIERMKRNHVGMKGKIAWNRGLTKETNKTIALAAIKTSQTRKKLGLGRMEKSGNWKGDNAAYHTKHTWLKNNFGSAIMCENKKCPKRSKNYQWANISGKYKRNRNDYFQLCIPCHHTYDNFKRKFQI